MILLLGSSGIISNHLQSYFNKNGNRFIVSTSNKNKSKSKDRFYFDLSRTDISINTCTNLDDIKVAIVCANLFPDSRETSEFLHLYRQAFSSLFKTLKAFNIYTIFLSSNRVFNGNIRLPHEESEPCPYITDTYGLCKYVAERELICSGNLNSAIIRLSKIIDPNFKLFDEWVSQLNSGERIKPLKMAVSPISLELTSTFINKVVVSGGNGIFHLSALADTTYVEVAKHIAHKLDFPKSMVIEDALSTGGNYQRLRLYDSLSMNKTLALINAPKAFDAVDKYLEKFCT